MLALARSRPESEVAQVLVVSQPPPLTQAFTVMGLKKGSSGICMDDSLARICSLVEELALAAPAASFWHPCKFRKN